MSLYDDLYGPDGDRHKRDCFERWLLGAPVPRKPARAPMTSTEYEAIMRHGEEIAARKGKG